MGQCLRKLMASFKKESKYSSENKIDKMEGSKSPKHKNEPHHFRMNESMNKDDSSIIHQEEPVQLVEPYQVFNRNMLIMPGEVGMKAAENFHLPFSTEDNYSYNLNLGKKSDAIPSNTEADNKEVPKGSVSKVTAQQQQLSANAREKALNIKLPSHNVIKEEEGEGDETVKSIKETNVIKAPANNETRGIVGVSKLPPLEMNKKKFSTLPMDDHGESEQFSKLRSSELGFEEGNVKEQFLPNTIGLEEKSLRGPQGMKYTNIFDDSERQQANDSQMSLGNSKRAKTNYPGLESLNKVLTQSVITEKNNTSGLTNNNKYDLGSNPSIYNKSDPPGEMPGGIIQGIGMDSSIEIKGSRNTSLKSSTGIGVLKKPSLKQGIVQNPPAQQIISPGQLPLQGQKGISYLQGSESDNKPESGIGSKTQFKEPDGLDDLFIKDFSEDEGRGSHGQGKGGTKGVKKMVQQTNGGILKSLQRDSILDEDRALAEEDAAKKKFQTKGIEAGTEKKEKFFDALQRPAVFGDFE